MSTPIAQIKPLLATASAMNILGFVPALVVQHFLKTMNQPRLLPESQLFRSVVMFADISGFTNLTEALSKIGNEGAEVIAFAINRYMELLVKEIQRSGGDIFKFAGDAMIVIWPPPPRNQNGGTDGEQEKLTTLLRQAIQSALDIQIKLNDTNILDRIKLSVKIGFGIGDINIIYVGGVFSRCEYIATGDPLNQAFESEHHAAKGGDTIASKDVYDMVHEYFEFDEIIEKDDGHKSENAPFYFIKNYKGKKVRMIADASLLTANLFQKDFELIKPIVMSYIPKALLPYIEIDQEPWSGELRRLTIMFVNLGIDLSLAKTKEGLVKIQKVIETVQKCVYYHEGSLNKLLMDDKGSTLIVVFGLPPLSHQDDPIRAVLTGFSLLRELAVINCRCSVGIATGTVYAGVIGTSGSRREYSVLGDSVNLSARLMQMACGEETKKIICCEITAGATQHKIMMRFYKMVKLKGKENDIPVYEPMQLSAKDVLQITKVEMFSDIRTHQNSLILNEKMLTDKKSMEQAVTQQFQMVGRDKQLQQLEKICDQFMKNVQPTGFIVIRGTYGIGKSLLVRVLLQKIKQDEQKYVQNNDTGVSVIISSLGPMSKTLKVNGFRQILEQLFIQIAQRQKKQPNLQFFKQIFPQIDYSDENYDLFQQLVGIKPNEWIQHFPPSQKDQIVLEHKLQLEKKQITQLTLLLFKHCVDDLAQNVPIRYDINSVSSQHSSQDGNSLLLGSNILMLHSMIIVLEDLNLYDYLTLHLVSQVLMHFQRILFISTVRDQYSEVNFITKKHSTQEKEKKNTVSDWNYCVGLQKIEDTFDQDAGFHSIDLVGLERNATKDQLKTLVKQQFNIDEFVLDKEYQIDNPPDVGMLKKYVDMKLNDHLIFSENKPWLWKQGISSIFYQYLYLRTLGNPLAVIYMVQNLIRSKMVTLSTKRANVGIIGAVFWQILDNEETITMEAPQCWVQVNGSIIDNLGCIESLLMKTASVIGDIFDIQTLHKIHSFKSTIQNERLIKILQELETKDLIEILDVSDFNIFYRFTHPFMREVIYQRMTYGQRKGIHLSVAEAIQTMTHPFEQAEDRERKRLEFHWTQAESKWTLDQTPSNLAIDKFSHKAKRSIIVKQIQQILSKSNNELKSVIKQGSLEKKSDRNVTWAARFVTMTSNEFKYYYTEKDYNNKVEPLGTIALKNIFGLMPLNEKEQGNKNWAFQVQASSWSKKGSEQPLRKFYFAALTEDILEEWSIFLEFAKAKAIYDDFVAHFGKISFPIGMNQDSYDQSIRIEIADPKRLNVTWGQVTEVKISVVNTNMSRRASRASKGMTPGSLKKSIDNGSNVNQNTQQDINNLKNLLKLFIKKSTSLFYCHIFEMCVQKNDESYRTFGKNIKIVQKNKQIFEIKQSEMRLIRREQKNNSDSDSDQSPTKSSNDLDEPNSGAGSPSTKTGRRRSSVSQQFHILEAIQEEDEKFKGVEDKGNKWQYVSKVDTQSSENYVTESQPQQDTASRYLNTMKPIVLAVSSKQKVSDPVEKFNGYLLKQISEQSNILPSNFDADYDEDSSIHYKSPVKYASSKGKIDSNTLKVEQKADQVEFKVEQKVESPQNILEQNKNSELDLQGVAVKDCYSLKGYQFFLQKNDKVSIKKIYEDNDYLKCSFRGMTGILKKSDLAYNLPDGMPSSMQAVANISLQKSTQKQSEGKKQKQQDDADRILASVKPFSNQPKSIQYLY